MSSKPVPPRRTRLVHDYFLLGAHKPKRAQCALGTATETETIERALDFVLSEHDRSGVAARANRDFLKSGIKIRDVFGALEIPGANR